jgi:hypothetical protein
LANDGIEYGVNGWSANTRDRRIHNEDEEEGDGHEQED